MAWVYIFFPLALGLALLLFAGLRRVVIGTGIGASALLVWLALTLPVERVVTLNPNVVFKLVESFAILGREFVLPESMRPFLTAVWVIALLWQVGALFANSAGRFVPLGLIFISLLIAALAVRPFLYAALLIELAVLLSIPMLVDPGRGASRGLLRYVAYHTIGMPFILFTGWMLAGVEASPGQLDLVVRAGLLLGVGFAFLLAVVPFHTWIPLLIEETSPFPAAFVITLLSGFVSIFGLTFLDRFVFLRDSEQVYILLRGFGAVMTLVGAVWIAFERRMGRMLGYALVLESGMFLLAIGLGSSDGIVIYFALALPRIVSVIVWAVALEQIKAQASDRFTLDGVRGFANQQPLVAFTLLIAVFSLAGLPGFSGFPMRQLVWQRLAMSYPISAAAALLGTAGLMFAGLRLLRSMVLPPPGEMPSGEAKPLSESVIPRSLSEVSVSDVLIWAFTGLGTLMSVVVGIFPHWFFPFIARLPEMFSQLGR
jgi:formate hydrogenlyase subunit 3/multisubunit Na+/H+ antiporter MnhD subunit